MKDAKSVWSKEVATSRKACQFLLCTIAYVVPESVIVSDHRCARDPHLFFLTKIACTALSAYIAVRLAAGLLFLRKWDLKVNFFSCHSIQTHDARTTVKGFLSFG